MCPQDINQKKGYHENKNSRLFKGIGGADKKKKKRRDRPGNKTYLDSYNC